MAFLRPRTGLPLLLAALAQLALLAPGVAAAADRGHSVKMRAQVRKAVTKTVKLSVVSQSLAEGATISGDVSWEVRTAGVRITSVAFAFDGATQWSDRSAPYLYGGGVLDTTKLSNGPHTLTATVYAKSTRPASASVTVNVSNQAAPAPAPTPAPEPAPTPEPTP
ncbi:MAG TPA: Ig-like domain-containing protein, partial [Solirubrobacterales bacterium]|nr:Ig-like domain-containing protein [Solirubrobacterales bacterium]